ncbi:coiled-coil domain-containing protein 138 [Herpailurus yagouaroundi]|uniref:coiled-coil domain-containing protein 138 n=1 Tax=Herpailurus yagouaroundi TaxID=1608482 RepID=UPI001AD7159E|nr:coiled-coil domain-containing protein 138 [Puma yagouaroundi]
MEARVVKPPGQDLVVERLKSLYGLGARHLAEYDFSNFDQAKWKRRSLTSPDDLDIFSSVDKVGSSLRCYSDERKHCTTPLCSSFKQLNVNCLDDELDSFQDLRQKEAKEDLIENDYGVSTSKITKQSFKDIEKVAQPTNLAANSRNWTECCSDASDCPLRRVSYQTSKVPNKQRILPYQINQIYDELFQIHQKLQCETAAQQEFAEELQKRERFLVEREQLLFRHETALSKIKGVEEEVLTRFQIIKEQHSAEVEHLTEVLKERNKESKRLRSSFDALKELNDNLKKQLLPVITEQLQWMPFVNAKLHQPFVKFIYWSLRQLDAGTQHSTMTSTLRRLGEDIFKGVVTKGIQDNSLDHSVENKPKTAAFFKSSNLPLRFLSTLIVLKTVTQADYLAQAFDSLCLDLKTDEGKILFLEYQAVPVILNHLRISSKGLLSNVIDSLLQMTVESKSLQPFLEACSNTLFFRTCSVLLRTPKLDLQILEKLSIILQKLSKIKSNKKLFELFTIHLMLQEMQRTTHPEHAFLCINLNSTLFNLGLTKCNSLASSASH